ncbi:MAG: NUDIX domain-containing protein [Anaerolineales bacterium]
MTDELLDIVNDNDEVIAQAMRSSVHEGGFLHRGVHAFLFDRQGRLLVQKRSARRAQYPSVWDCSVSEHVKASESYHRAIQRGMLEELGVAGVEVRPLVRFRMEYGHNDHEISTLFEGAVDPVMVTFDTGEIAQVEYHSLAELRAFLENGERPFSHWFEQLLRWTLHEPSVLQVLEIY